MFTWENRDTSRLSVNYLKKKNKFFLLLQKFCLKTASSKLWYKDKSIYDLESYTSSIYDYEFDEKEYKRVIRQKQSSESLVGFQKKKIIYS